MIILTNAQARTDFLHHAYNACFSGNIMNFEPEVRREMLKVVFDDLCTAARTLPPGEQEQLIIQFNHRMRGGN